MKWSKIVLFFAVFTLMASIQKTQGQDPAVAPLPDSGVGAAETVSPETANAQTPETVWNSAEQLRAANLSEAAAQEYERIAVQWPKSKEAAPAALQAAEIYQSLGLNMQALAASDKALSVANDWWEQQALFTKASVCSDANCRDDALVAIRRLRAEYPESYWTVRSGLVEAKLQGINPATVQAALNRYEEADAMRVQAIQLLEQGKNEAAIALLSQIATSYADSPAALHALDAQGHYMIRLNRKPDAIPVFADLLVRTGQATPQARIVRRAKLRLAALCRVGGRITEAQKSFEELAKNSDQPSVASTAALNLIGIRYEQLRDQLDKTKAVDAAGWAALRQKCRTLAESPWCQARERIRSELVEVESYCWERNVDGAHKACVAFLGKYDGTEYVHELATARLFVGIELYLSGRYSEALGYYRWIQQHAPKYSPRVYREMWLTLGALGAPAEEITQVENILYAMYPNSPSVRFIEIFKRQEAERNARHAK